MTYSLVVYLLIGAILASFFDRDEMREQVPYGKVPAGYFSLTTIRVIMCGVAALCWLPCLVLSLAWKLTHWGEKP